MSEELIVFVNESGKPTGETGAKLASHHLHTQLHLAFSCYLFRKSDRHVLITRRAKTKKVWPGVWTNSMCGHPGPGEKIEEAIKRRAKYELGITQLQGINCLIPDFIYKTEPYNGVIEHEFCPVFMAVCDGRLALNPKEVEAYEWLPWQQFVRRILDYPDTSYWAQKQLMALKENTVLQAFLQSP